MRRHAGEDLKLFGQQPSLSVLESIQEPTVRKDLLFLTVEWLLGNCDTKRTAAKFRRIYGK